MTKLTTAITTTLRKGNLADIKNLCETYDLSIPDDVTKQNAYFYLALRSEPEDQQELTEICDFLKDKIDCKQVDANGQTALFYASRDGNYAMAKFLVDNGVDVNHIDTANQQTCLFFATRDNRIDCMTLLMDNGATVDFQDKNLQTPLFYGASHGCDAAINLLLERGADVQHKDTQRRTAAWFARMKSHTSAESILKAHLAKVNPSAAAAAAAPSRSARATAPATSGEDGGTSRGQRQSAARSNNALLSSLVAMDMTDVAPLPPRQRKAPSSIMMLSGNDLTAPPSRQAANRSSSKQVGNAHSSGASQQQQQLQVQFGNITRYKCRIVCRPSADPTHPWILPDDDVLQELETVVCPEIAQWQRTAVSGPFQAEWTRKWQREARILLENIMRSPDAVNFLRPVDVQRLKCFDYYTVIKIPMDFSTVRNRLRDLRYTQPKDLLFDVSLIFENCRRYNPATSLVAMSGVRLDAEWEAMLKNSTLQSLQAEWEEFQARKQLLLKIRMGVFNPEKDRECRGESATKAVQEQKAPVGEGNNENMALMDSTESRQGEADQSKNITNNTSSSMVEDADDSLGPALKKSRQEDDGENQTSNLSFSSTITNENRLKNQRVGGDADDELRAVPQNSASIRDGDSGMALDTEEDSGAATHAMHVAAGGMASNSLSLGLTGMSDEIDAVAGQQLAVGVVNGETVSPPIACTVAIAPVTSTLEAPVTTNGVAGAPLSSGMGVIGGGLKGLMLDDDDDDDFSSDED